MKRISGVTVLLIVLACHVALSAPPSGPPRKVGILVVYSASDPDSAVPALNVIKRLKELRTKAGYTPDRVPMMAYYFDKHDEQKKCQALQIGAGDLPFVGIVALNRDGDPAEVLNRLPEVQDASAADTVMAKVEALLGLKPAAPRAPDATTATLSKGLEAFDAGRFADPVGDNAVEAARKALILDPHNTAASELEGRAVRAYENQAQIARNAGDSARAILMYDRLFQLYPDHQEYHTQAEGLRAAGKRMAQAQEALAAGRYDEAILLARQMSKDDPQNAAAKDIETRVAAAGETQASQAVSRNDSARALEIYRRLLVLFPARSDYQRQIEALDRPPPAPDIAGTWMRNALGEITSGDKKTELRSDGSATWYGPIFTTVRGTWVCVDARQRVFKISWNDGTGETVTLDADRKRMEGTTLKGFRVTYSR